MDVYFSLSLCFTQMHTDDAECVCVCVFVCADTDDAEIASLKDEVYELIATVLPRIQTEVADLKKTVAN